MCFVISSYFVKEFFYRDELTEIHTPNAHAKLGLVVTADDPSPRELITTQIFPYNVEFFENALIKVHFHDLKFYGNMKLEEFDRVHSKNLFVVAEK